jgi:hypothetical protein
MNKKQLLERQITKNFLGNALNEAQDAGPATQAKIDLAKSAGKAALDNIPVAGKISSAAEVAQNLLKVRSYNDLYNNTSSVQKDDIKKLYSFIKELNKAIEPRNLASAIANDSDDFAVNIVNAALEKATLNGDTYELAQKTPGNLGGEMLRPNRRMENK